MPLGRCLDRAEVYDLPHRVLTLPQSVGTQCIDLVSRLGLMFGAIDLILAPDGRYLFLEINPNGQWYWLEEITGVPLTTTISRPMRGTMIRPIACPTFACLLSDAAAVAMRAFSRTTLVTALRSVTW